MHELKGTDGMHVLKGTDGRWTIACERGRTVETTKLTNRMSLWPFKDTNFELKVREIINKIPVLSSYVPNFCVHALYQS